jgi:hypothetical protein
MEEFFGIGAYLFSVIELIVGKASLDIVQVRPVFVG